MQFSTEDDEQESEIVYINPRRDILSFEIPLTHDKQGQTEEFKKIAATGLANRIMELIEPEYFEMNGFELMRYEIIVKKYTH